MVSVSRVFLSSRLMLLLLAIGLSVTLLLSSSMVMVQMYINRSVDEALEGLDYHSLFYIGLNSTDYESIREFMDNIVGSSGYVEDYVIESVVVKTHITSNESIVLGGESISLYNYTLYIIYTERVNDTYLLIPLHTLDVKSGTRASFNGLDTVFLTKEDFIERIRYGSYKWLSWFLDTLLLYDEMGKMDKIVLVTPASNSSYVYSVLERHVVVYTWTRDSMVEVLPKSIEFPRVPPELQADLERYRDDLYSLVREFLKRQNSFYTIAYIAIRFKAEAVVYSTSMSLSILKSVIVEDTLYKTIRRARVAVAPKESKLPELFSKMTTYETISRFTALFSTLPSIVMVLIVSEKTPPVIISLLRKNIALMRIRGLGIDKLKKHFMLSSIILGLIGFTIGLFLGPLLAIIVYSGCYRDYMDYLPLVLNPINIAITLVATIGVIATSIWRNFGLLEKIPPYEFTRPLMYMELGLVKTGMGKIGWISLFFGVYFILRIMRFIDPYRIYMEYSGSPAMLIIAVILLMLEPVVLLLGPVMLVYGIAKLLIAYPRYTIEAIGRLVKPFTREYTGLVVKLLYSKPARITLSIIAISFSLSILLAGLLGADSVSHAMYELQTIASGSDYVFVKPLILSNNSVLENELESLEKTIGDHSYTYAVLVVGPIFNDTRDIPGIYSSDIVHGMYRGYTWAKTYYIEGDSRQLYLNYILFVDPINYYRVLDVPDSILFSGESASVFEGLSGWRALFVSNASSYSLYGDYRLYTLLLDKREAVLHDTGYSIEIHGSLRNLPSIYSIVKAYEGVYGVYTPIYTGLYSTRVTFLVSGDIPVVYMDPGVIMSIDVLDEFIELNRRLYSGAYGYKGLFTLLYIFVDGELGVGLESSIESMGYSGYCSREVYSRIGCVREFLDSSFSQSISTGLILYSISILVSLVLVYTSLYEDLYAYTLLRARGVSSSTILRVSVAEIIAIALLGILPGVLLGLVLGSGLASMFFTSMVTMVELPGGRGLLDVYGVGFRIHFTLATISYIVVPVAILLILDIAVILSSYKRVVREALALLGSHV